MNIFKLFERRLVSSKRRNILIVFFTALFLFGLLSLLVLFRPFAGMSLIELDELADKHGISLSDNKELLEKSAFLEVDPLKNVMDLLIHQADEYTDEIINTDGQLDNQNLFGYTFYLSNEGTASTDVSFKFLTNESNKELSEAVMVRLMRFDYISNELIDDYYYVDPNKLDYIMESDEVPLNYKEIDYRLFDEAYLLDEFARDGVYKFSLIIWVDGFLSNPNHLYKSVELTLLFAVDEED